MKKKPFQNNTKDSMTHFNISVVKRRRDNKSNKSTKLDANARKIT